MSDKPKRKNSPHRRRKFLLVLILLALLVSGGVAVLSPQIEAWLATDPFTPQCHFEEDRLFITGHPYQLTSINRGQYEPLDDFGAISQLRWSPDGTMFTARDPLDNDDRTNLLLVSADGHVIREFDKEVGSSVRWSFDSRYFEFSSGLDYRYTVESEELFSYVTPIDGWGLTFGTNLSPNGRYKAHVMNRLEGYVTWFVDDLENEYSAIEVGSWLGSEVNFAGWSVDSQFIYFVTSDFIKQFDVKSRELSELLELPYSPYAYQISMSSDAENIIMLRETDPLYINLNTLEMKTFGENIDANKLGWIDNPYWVYGELRDDSDIYESIQVYDTVTNISRQLDIPAGIDRYKVELSPSGHYLMYYLDIATESESPYIYAIYDLETDVEHIIGSYPLKHRIEWFSHQGRDYLLVQEQVTADQSQPYLATLIDAEDLTSCKIGFTAWTLEFQPQG